MSWVFLNGEILPEIQASVPVTDRGFLFGDGVFTTCKVENGTIVQWNVHCERLRSQCATLNIHPPELDMDFALQLIEKNQATEGTWRLKIVITGGNSSQLSLPRRTFGTVLMTLHPFEVPEGPVRVCRYPAPVELPLAKMKTLSYLHRLMVKQYAIDRGVDDAIVCSAEGWVMESAFSNIYWREGEETVIPDLSLSLLPGTYLSSIQGCKEEKLTYEQLREKEQVYLCNALCVRPCICV